MMHSETLTRRAGKMLSQSIREVYDNFMSSMGKWHNIDFDILDPAAAGKFSDAYKMFRSSLKDLERRLCQVVMSALDDCANMSSTFKLLDSFEGLLERDFLAQVCGESNSWSVDLASSPTATDVGASAKCVQHRLSLPCRRWKANICNC
jgi:Dynein heavy chain, N-terminal region 1